MNRCAKRHAVGFLAMVGLVGSMSAAEADSASAATVFEQPRSVETNANAVLNINAPSGTSFTNNVGMALVKLPTGYWVGAYEVTQTE